MMFGSGKVNFVMSAREVKGCRVGYRGGRGKWRADLCSGS